MDETMALLQIEKMKDRKYEYQGDDPDFQGEIGEFERLDDMNCCAPTDAVLFAFQCKGHRKVMTAEQFLEFVQTCKAVEK